MTFFFRFVLIFVMGFFLLGFCFDAGDHFSTLNAKQSPKRKEEEENDSQCLLAAEKLPSLSPTALLHFFLDDAILI